MSDKAVIRACYSDFKIIKTRKVCSISVEIPLEQAQAFIHAFGLPQPGAEQWVALAGLQTPAKEETPPTASVRAHRPFPELPYPQQAALRCQDLSFREFLRQHKHELECNDSDDAATIVRRYCGVQSRAEIRPGTEAEKRWLRLNTEYTFWESARAA